MMEEGQGNPASPTMRLHLLGPALAVAPWLPGVNNYWNLRDHLGDMSGGVYMPAMSSRLLDAIYVYYWSSHGLETRGHKL